MAVRQNFPFPGLNWWRIAPNKFHVIYGESTKKAEGKMDKGVIRCASWQLRYSQVRIQNGIETEVFAHTVPGTFIIRSSCTDVDRRNAESKRAINGKKEAIIALLKSNGYTEQLNLKRPYSKLVSLAADMGLMSAADDKTCAKRKRR